MEGNETSLAPEVERVNGRFIMGEKSPEDARFIDRTVRAFVNVVCRFQSLLLAAAAAINRAWRCVGRNAQAMTALGTLALAAATFYLAFTASIQIKSGLEPAIDVTFSPLLSDKLEVKTGQFGVILHNFGPIAIRDLLIEPIYYTLTPGLQLNSRLPSPSYASIRTKSVRAEATVDYLLDLRADLKTFADESRISPGIICARIEFRHEVTSYRALRTECLVRDALFKFSYRPFGGVRGVGGSIEHWRRENKILIEIREFEKKGA